MKRDIVIGAGISGLSAGIFAKINGFSVEIYEMNSKLGGECTGWNRKGYHFDNCIHWLTGTNKDTELYKIWGTVRALENTEIINFEYLNSFNCEGEKIYLYRDLEKLKDNLLTIAPEDKSEILKLIGTIKKIQKLEIPTKDMDLMSFGEGIGLMKSYLGVRKTFLKLSKISVAEYPKRFKNKEFIDSSMPVNYSIIGLIFMLGIFTSDNGAYPKGGSLAMTKGMDNKLESMSRVIN